jgi:glycosyltransferase involved in cell wall biosynthesis
MVLYRALRMPDLVYLSYDRVPAPKGAAVHIAAFVDGLRPRFQRLDLVTVAGEGTLEGHQGIALPRGTFIEQVLAFRAAVDRWWRGRGEVEVAHFRSIFEGYPLARRRAGRARRLVYEVNALPSIELKYQFPAVAEDDELLTKLRAQERACLDAADLVLTTNAVTAALLGAQGAGDRLRVIPNGVDPDLFAFAPVRPGGGPLRLLYSGTLSSWQGLGTALDALALVRAARPASLTVVGSARKRQRQALQHAARERGLDDAVAILPPVSQAELARLHHGHDLVLAPLVSNDRNCVQGCCPLKVIEAMACGTPLVASNLAVVRELVADGQEATLVDPGSARALAAAILAIAEDGPAAARLARAARARVEAGMTWRHRQAELRAAYADVLGI